MNDPNALDQLALGTYLEAHVSGFADLRSIRKFTSGQSNPTYLLEARSGRYVLRAKPPGALLKSAHQVDREYRVMKALADSAVPVPAMLHLSGKDSPIGRMFYVMEFVEGRIFWDPALPDVASNEDRAQIFDAMNRTLAALHDLDVDAPGLADFGRPGNYFERQMARWSSQYRASETETVEDVDALIAWLETAALPKDGQSALIHGDYRLDNMIFAQTGNRIAALLDWELSTLGHPLADLAYQCMQWRMPNDFVSFRGLGGIDRKALGLPSETEYIEAYCRRRGVDAMVGWAYALAFSFFRMAAICQGVYRRALDGNASNPDKARTYGDLVKTLARLGVESIEKRAR